jgi:natural product biosynthesis luciferase-like monooxygenase protein
MQFGIMFFASAEQTRDNDRYLLLKSAAQFADQHNFCCVWTPERHFHDFGGIFPNPSVISAALAMITKNIQLRAGSLVSPLHNAIRIAEEWAVVDNLSGGRVAISFGSGWNIDDFVFFPDRYSTRQAVMYEQINTVKDLWTGKALPQINPVGKEISVRLAPPPIQANLPVWITSSGNAETFRKAGAIGANVLTHLLGQDILSVSEKIAAYRESREKHGHDPNTGIVSLMLHTYLDSDMEKVRAEVRTPFREYLRSAVSLEKESASGGGVISGGRKISPEEIEKNHMEEMLDLAFERYFSTASLMGTPSSCSEFVNRLESIGVDEIACLIDFGIPTEKVLAGLAYLAVLQDQCSSGSAVTAASEALQEFTASF